jgi:hypothetical protein
MADILSNPWAADTWHLGQQAQYEQRYGTPAAERMARIAGTKIGGLPKKPAGQNKIYIIQGKRGPAGRDGSSGAGAGTHEFLGFYAAGTFGDAQVFTASATPRATSFPTISPPDESRATCRVAPTSDVSFYLVSDVAEFMGDGSTLICTITFAANSLAGSFVYGSPISVPIDTALFIVCPLTADPAITDVQIVFCGDPT